MFKKGPAYSNCNERQSSCTRRDAKPRQGCPNCEFTILYKAFVAKLTDELSRLRKGTRKGARRWPVKDLIKTAVEVASVSGSSEVMLDTWTVPVSILVSIYRGEDAKIKAAENYVPPSETETKKGPLIRDSED
jgi:hypothetical protein